MERISENDVDCFLQQMAQVFAPLPEMGKCREEWRHLPGFRIWLPGSFQLADRETAEEVFWSEALPEMLYMTEDGTAGITLQTMEDREVSVQEVRQRLERLDERIVCYGSGTEEGRAGVRWLEYKSFAADGRVYNVLFLFRAGGCDRLGTFYCPYEEYGGWKPVVWEIMRTIEEENDHEGL